MIGPIGRSISFMTLVVVIIGNLPLYAQEQPSVPVEKPASMQPPPPIPLELLDRHTFRVSPVEQVSPGKYKVDEIMIDKAEKTVSFPAEVNMNKGLLEYLLVRFGGKMHESLLRTKTEPYNLQVACLLLGIEGSSTPLAFQGAPEIPTGDHVEITLRLADGKSVSPESWMIHSVDGVIRDVPKIKWIFTGSVVNSGRFAAQSSGSMIAVFHDPVAMIDNASPGGESDKIWAVNENTTPSVGTPVTVVIKSTK